MVWGLRDAIHCQMESLGTVRFRAEWVINEFSSRAAFAKASAYVKTSADKSAPRQDFED